MKDWSGNSRTTFVTLGASNHTDKEREENDYYATDPIAIDVLLKDECAVLNHDIWECACGAGDLSKRLEEYGYNVKSTDLIDRGYGQGGIDFLKCQDKWHGDILTNPPYKYAQEFVEHGLELIEDGNSVWMFLKLQFLEGQKRRQLFDTGQLKYIFVSTKRILCAKNGEFDYMREHGGSAVAYAWYQFVKGYKDNAVVRWIN